jgi:hypothetical protein
MVAAARGRARVRDRPALARTILAVAAAHVERSPEAPAWVSVRLLTEQNVQSATLISEVLDVVAINVVPSAMHALGTAPAPINFTAYPLSTIGPESGYLPGGKYTVPPPWPPAVRFVKAACRAIYRARVCARVCACVRACVYVRACVRACACERVRVCARVRA